MGMTGAAFQKCINPDCGGTLQTAKGIVSIRHFTHTEDMVIVVELESAGGEGLMQVEWKPPEIAELVVYLVTHKGNAVIDELHIRRAASSPWF